MARGGRQRSSVTDYEHVCNAERERVSEPQVIQPGRLKRVSTTAARVMEDTAKRLPVATGNTAVAARKAAQVMSHGDDTTTFNSVPPGPTEYYWPRPAGTPGHHHGTNCSATSHRDGLLADRVPPGLTHAPRAAGERANERMMSCAVLLATPLRDARPSL